ncbi:RNA polymerase sigma factor [Nocardioides marmorisolisilvae]|uniref:Sigma-70 family RNA polymerase sigma factor n=1 Tax=Nocardioides marmorisolisilvae TaxID=1542737 RepID=A0A3N0DQ87_9ACTN|nr:sigma-70 family RNA polymerase sigma factor [Nocardioides marmorisolisilvae]RNL77671.1 sigma-70 family RNA polymerase sigma factor [Nocardioides marmorisolisilvae]
MVATHRPVWKPMHNSSPLVPGRDLDDLTDTELLTLVRSGDPTAYGVLFRRHHRTAVRIAGATVGHGLAEEHAAEAFTRVLELLRRGLGPEASFLPYLVTTIRNLNIDHVRKQRPVHLVEDVARWADTAEESQDWLDRLAHGEAAEAYRRLPERWRQVLRLRTIEGWSLAETAQALGLSPNAAAQLSLRAREGLRAEYFTSLGRALAG